MCFPFVNLTKQTNLISFEAEPRGAKMLILLAIAVLVLLSLWWWLTCQRMPDKYPRGPYGLPFIGYLPVILADNILVGLEEVHKRFGPNVSLNLGPGKRIVFIGDYETLKVI